MGVARRMAARAVMAQQGEQRRTILKRTVELEVIPRLLQAHGTAAAVASAALAAANAAEAASRTGPKTAGTVAFLLTAEHVADLVSVVLADGDAATVGFVERMHGSGAKPEAIYLDLLAPAARQLGVMWEDDACDFTQVTMGLWRLQSAMRELSPVFQPVSSVSLDGPRILLVPLPGETHTFGLSMVYEFFHRAGWNAWTGPIGSSAELCDLVRNEWVEVIGFSLACDALLESARVQIAAVRRASRNPNIGVLVGGPGFIENPSLAASIGADGTATDGRQAVRRAQALMDVASLTGVSLPGMTTR